MHVWRISGLEKEVGSLSSIQCKGHWHPLSKAKGKAAAKKEG